MYRWRTRKQFCLRLKRDRNELFNGCEYPIVCGKPGFRIPREGPAIRGREGVGNRNVGCAVAGHSRVSRDFNARRNTAQPAFPLQAVAIVDQLLELPHVSLISETEQFWPHYKKEILGGHLRGGVITDALICGFAQRKWRIHHLYSRQGVLKFRGIRAINPLG